MPVLLTAYGRRGGWFASAAVLVTAPRLVLAFLAADGIALPGAVRTTLLCTSSVATAICLTGGGAYLAQAVAATRGGGGRVLGVLWLLILAASSALMAPVLAAGLATSPLAAVLGGPAERWGWAICAVLAVDLVAAAVMRADGAVRRQQEDRAAAHEREVAELIEQRDRARAVAARGAEAAAASPAAEVARPAAQASLGEVGSVPGPRLDAARSAAAVSGRRAPGAPRVCACGRVFASGRGYSGHRRLCRAAASEAPPPVA